MLRLYFIHDMIKRLFGYFLIIILTSSCAGKYTVKYEELVADVERIDYQNSLDEFTEILNISTIIVNFLIILSIILSLFIFILILISYFVDNRWFG